MSVVKITLRIDCCKKTFCKKLLFYCKNNFFSPLHSIILYREPNIYGKQTMKRDKYQIDMTRGPLAGKIILFALPLLFSYILQLLFNAADLIVIGQFSTAEALAAIGCTANLNALVINIFIGLSIGTNVLAAKYFGAKDHASLAKVTHTAIAIAFYGGIIMMIIGLAVAKPLLILMQTPPEILPLSCKYLWICFSAIPCIMLYNFGCAVLRAVGDTRRPLYFLITAGIVNVVLNMILVIIFKLSAEGVAIATAISHALSAALVIRVLLKSKEAYHLDIKKIRFDIASTLDTIKIGLPAGLQSSCFAISNMLIQSTINTFGLAAIAGMAATSVLESMVYISSFSFHQTSISFVSQNLGADKYKRIMRSLVLCTIFGTLICGTVGYAFLFFGRELLQIFNPDPDVINWGLLRMKMLFTLYFLCGFMDTSSGGLRGLGYSILSTLISLFGACVFRVLWVTLVFPYYKTMECVLISYPISWALVGIGGWVSLLFIYRKVVREKSGRNVFWSKNAFGFFRGYRFIGMPK